MTKATVIINLVMGKSCKLGECRQAGSPLPRLEAVQTPLCHSGFLLQWRDGGPNPRSTPALRSTFSSAVHPNVEEAQPLKTLPLKYFLSCTGKSNQNHILSHTGVYDEWCFTVVSYRTWACFTLNLSIIPVNLSTANISV